MAVLLGAVEVEGVPSGASVDDLAVVIGQFGSIQRILISSRGARGAGNALIVLPQASASEVAEALDSYPLSGGLLESRVCHDTASWVRRYVGHQLLDGLSPPASPSAPVALPQLPPPPAATVPLPIPLAPPAGLFEGIKAQPVGTVASQHVAVPDPSSWEAVGTDLEPHSLGHSSTGDAITVTKGPGVAPGYGSGAVGGAAAIEAELRSLQLQMQHQVATAGGDQQFWEEEEQEEQEGEDGWQHDAGSREGGHSPSLSFDGSESVGDAGWQQIRTPRSGGPSSVPAGAAGAAGSNPRIVVTNVSLGLKRHTAQAFFKQFGFVQECLTFAGKPYAFVHFRDASAAEAAVRALHRRLVPPLNPNELVWADFRAPREPYSRTATKHAEPPPDTNRLRFSATPTATLFVGRLAPWVNHQGIASIFSKYGAIYDCELREATNDRPDKYAFVNYRRVEDAQAAFEALDGRAIPAATGKVPLKLQYRRG